MANGQVTRTVFTALAYCWQMDGNNEDGSPRMVRVGDVEFVSTKPTQTEAYRALANAGIKCKKDFCGFDITDENIYGMDIDTFIENAVVVERTDNGRVKAIAE